MPNVMERLHRFVMPFTRLSFALKCLVAVLIVVGMTIGIVSWQDAAANYWRDFNTVRVTRLRTQKEIAVGEPAPPFTLKSKDGNQNVTLQSLGRKPVVLIFGSYSCGPFRNHFRSIDQLHRQYGDEVTFCFIYKVESHPMVLPHVRSLAERVERAARVCAESDSSMLVLADDLQNSVADAYHVFDEKVVLIDQGRIDFFNQGHPEGPDFNMVEELKTAIVDLLARKNS